MAKHSKTVFPKTSRTETTAPAGTRTARPRRRDLRPSRSPPTSRARPLQLPRQSYPNCSSGSPRIVTSTANSAGSISMPVFSHWPPTSHCRCSNAQSSSPSSLPISTNFSWSGSPDSSAATRRDCRSGPPTASPHANNWRSSRVAPRNSLTSTRTCFSTRSALPWRQKAFQLFDGPTSVPTITADSRRISTSRSSRY